MPISMTVIWNIGSTKCWWGGHGAMGTLIDYWSECKVIQPFWKIVWWFLTKLNALLLYDLAATCLGIYLNKLKIYVHTKTCTQMFIAALFIIAQIWKQPRCSSVGKWINKLWYIQTMEYYSVLKRNELSQGMKRHEGNLNAYYLVKEAKSV